MRCSAAWTKARLGLPDAGIKAVSKSVFEKLKKQKKQLVDRVHA